MNRHSALLALVCAACSQAPSPSPVVTEPVWHLEVAMATVEGEVGPAAVTYLGDADLGLSDEEELVVHSVSTGTDTLRHVRLQETHRGVPVLGSEIAVHADDTTFLGYGGTVTRNLEGVPVEPSIDGEEALAIARDHLAAAAGSAIRPARESTLLALRPRPGAVDLVWRVEVLVEVQAGVAPGRWFYLVDAGTGEVLDRHDGLTTAEQASGPGGNPKSERSWSAALDVESVGGEYAMETRRLVTLDMKNEKEGGEVVRGPIDPIGDAAINDAHGFAEVTLGMMRDWMGYDSINDKGFPIRSRVHYDVDLANAFWDGEQMTYGDGGDTFYPLSGGLDVVAHEISHGFTEMHSNLEYRGASGGLNESFSDVAGAAAELYHDPSTANFLVGEGVIREGAALRFMCDPQADHRSIDHADDFGGLTDPHISSGIANKAFCLAVARTVASGASHADAMLALGRVWYLANASFWTSESSFSQGCQGTVDAARSFGLSSEVVAGIHQSWADVGVYCESGLEIACDADGLCDGGDGETCYSCATDCGACTEQCGWWKEFKCSVGIGDCSRCEHGGSPCGDGVCEGDESDESCGQDCGCRAPDDSCGGLAPYGCWCDSECEENGDCCADAGVCQ
jgi:Zn-dependent metalloprotease